jgi:error-prone DNA polymerase
VAPYAELHCHTNFSFLDGASPPDELTQRAVELGLSGLAVTDHGGLYGVVRFATAAQEAGLRPILGIEIELMDAAAPDPAGVVVPPRRPRRHAPAGGAPLPGDGLPARPRPDRARLPGHRDAVKEDLRGIGEGQRGPHLVLLARNATGYRSLCRLVSRANLAGTKSMPRFRQELLAEHADGLVALSGCREGEIARRLRVGDREGARAAAERYARLFGGGVDGSRTRGASARGDGPATAGFFLELQHHLLPDDDWLVAETALLAEEMGLPVVVTNDVHYAHPEGRELHDVLTAIRHGRSLDELRDLRRPDGESYLKSADELMAMAGRTPPGGVTLGFAGADARTTSSWAEGIGNAGELAASCSVDLGFERYRFPGFPVPKSHTPFSYLEELCHEGARRRYHPISAPVLRQLAHEMDVIERTGLAEFFLICWDLMSFARERGIPAQGRGSAADSIVAYVLGITRVDPIRHNLLFERFINEGRTSYPDVDIDFSSARREEVIQYVYRRYGPEHTGMVCNLVTYRARSAVREVGYALGFPRPLVDRVAKALETYDSVMVRRDLEADGGFGQFFAQTVEREAVERGLTDRMGQLNHPRGGPVARGADAGATRVADLGGGPAVEQQRRLARRRVVGSDDEGGPGDSPASIAWLAAERAATRDLRPPSLSAEAVAARAASGGRAAASGGRTAAMPAEVRRGSTAGLPDWERWLAFCARIDGFPRHLSIHTGGMLVTAAPLIDIAPLERATMPGRVVVQFDKRDVETIKLIKLDLLGLGMLAAIDETLALIEADCAACVDLDRLPEDVPEVFAMLQAADTVGVFQVESRAQMQTLPKSRPANLDDLVVEVAIIRPGPIQGNAVHPYLRRRQGIEPVVYLHPSLEPVLRETLGVILYQEQVMQIAITVAGFSAGESDGFRRAMGTWRSSREMEKLHARFVGGCKTTNGLTDEQAEELFRGVAAFASFGFAKSHAAAFARTAYESAFLKLFYPAQFTVGLINAQPMGFYPVEVLINDVKRHGVAVLPVDINASSYKTTTEWVGRDGEPLPEGAGIARRPAAVRSSGCVTPSVASRSRWTPEMATGYGIRLGLALVKGIGDERAERLDAEPARGPYRSLADVVARTEMPEEVIERLIRAGALDSLGRPRRELLWQLREVMGATRGRVAGRTARTAGGSGGAAGGSGGAAGRPMDLRLPPTPAPELPALTERERLGDSYAVLSLDARRQVVSLFRPALERLGAVTNASLADRGPGPVRLGGLVVTRQHPMTARGTVFLALEDETGMVNVTLWPDTWARLRGVVRRHALLYVEGMLQREASVVNVVAREIRPLPEVAERVG